MNHKVNTLLENISRIYLPTTRHGLQLMYCFWVLCLLLPLLLSLTVHTEWLNISYFLFHFYFLMLPTRLLASNQNIHPGYMYPGKIYPGKIHPGCFLRCHSFLGFNVGFLHLPFFFLKLEVACLELGFRFFVKSSPSLSFQVAP